MPAAYNITHARNSEVSYHDKEKRNLTNKPVSISLKTDKERHAHSTSHHIVPFG